MKEYRFFYHYYKKYKMMSIHFRGACHKVRDIKCHTFCETKWNKTQPNLVMRGWATDIEIKDGVAHIYNQNK